VETGEGPVTGRKNAEYSSCEWRGIPFAAPPVGELRWKRPLPPEPRDGLLEAVANGPS
jgi:para-nitrobenzyl esterase